MVSFEGGAFPCGVTLRGRAPLCWPGLDFWDTPSGKHTCLLQLSLIGSLEPGCVNTKGLQQTGTAQSIVLTWGQVFHVGSQGKTATIIKQIFSCLRAPGLSQRKKKVQFSRSPWEDATSPLL